MSKFKDASTAAAILDDDRDTELEAFRKKALDEMILRLRYDLVRKALRVIETLDAVPDDWRAKLAAFKGMADWLGDLPKTESDEQDEAIEAAL